MESLSIWHWLIFLVVAFLLFGGSNWIFSIMGDVAKGIKSFEKGMTDNNAPAAHGPGHPDVLRHRNSVFLSYRRSDSIDVTGRIYDKLVGALGRDAVFKDIDSIPLGVDFRQHIAECLKGCKIFILIVGKNWQGEPISGHSRRIDDPRDVLRVEVETALSRNIPIIPVLVHGVELPPEDMLPQSIRNIAYRQAIQVRPDPDFHRDVERVITFLKTKL